MYKVLDDEAVAGIATGVAQATKEFVATSTAHIAQLEVEDDTIQKLQEIGVIIP